jgi:hypothetical protein
VNAADMHRVRQSVSYFEAFGYKPIVMAVKPECNENVQDELLIKTLPKDLEIIWIDAFSSKWTRKIGLGALALRSLYFYWKAGNKLLKNRQIDLVYFSTTMFPVLILGAYWKKHFNTPYVIDMQDPWHSEFYQNKPKNERPPKYWFSYNLNKFMEPIAMKKVDGIISVSQGYCDILQQRYPNITPEKCIVIPFGAFEKDFEIIKESKGQALNIHHSSFIITYIGRGGNDMAKSLRVIFGAFKKGLETLPALFSKIKMQFIGTSYAPGSTGKKTIEPIAVEMGISEYVIEQPARISYFASLKLLKEADLLLVPGSEDPNYTASKLYPYIMAKKPILAVFSQTSSVIKILDDTKAGEFVAIDFNDPATFETQTNVLLEKWKIMLEKHPFVPDTNWKAFVPYTAMEMTKKQAVFFDSVLSIF